MKSGEGDWLRQFVKKQSKKKSNQARKDFVIYLKGAIDNEKNHIKKQYLQGYYDGLIYNNQSILKTIDIEKSIAELRSDVNSIIEKQQRLDREFNDMKKGR